MATGRLVKVLEYLGEVWMRVKTYLTGPLRGHVDPHIESSNDRPCSLISRRRPLLRPVVEFVGRDSLQDVSGEVVLNFETLLVEL
jgi:hypothetical protein